MAGILRHRQPKGSVTDRPRLNHPATSLLYKTALKRFGHRDLKALLSDILGRREGKSRAESDPAMTIAVIGAHGRRGVDDDERMDHYAALRW